MNIRDQFMADVKEFDRQRILSNEAAYALKDGLESRAWEMSMEFDISFRFDDDKDIVTIANDMLKLWERRK